jgi:glycerate 2-kinase
VSQPLRVLVAPNSFKTGASANVAGEAFRQGVEVFARMTGVPIVTRMVPICDGGTGFCQIMSENQPDECEWVEVETRDALGRPAIAKYAMSPSGVAFIECAKIIGLAMIDAKDLSPMATTSFGVGTVLKDALDRQVRKVLVGCGDSATVDCGVGLMAGLGARFWNADGVEMVDPRASDLTAISRVDLPRFSTLPELQLACNLSSIAAGRPSAARVYGGQKGASPDEIEELVSGFELFSRMVGRTVGNPDLGLFPGTGAAGGVGFGAAAIFPGVAELAYSFEVVFPAIGIDSHLEWADVVVTGEGLFDRNSVKGKAPVAVALRAKLHGATTVGIVGSIETGALSHLIRSGFDVLEPLTSPALSRERYIEDFDSLAREATTRAFLSLWTTRLEAKRG